MWGVCGHPRALAGGGGAAGRAAPVPIPGFTLGGVAYAAATLIALWSPVAALIIFGLLGVYYMFGAPAQPGRETCCRHTARRLTAPSAPARAYMWDVSWLTADKAFMTEGSPGRRARARPRPPGAGSCSRSTSRIRAASRSSSPSARRAQPFGLSPELPGAGARSLMVRPSSPPGPALRASSPHCPATGQGSPRGNARQRPMVPVPTSQICCGFTSRPQEAVR